METKKPSQQLTEEYNKYIKEVRRHAASTIMSIRSESPHFERFSLIDEGLVAILSNGEDQYVKHLESVISYLDKIVDSTSFN